MSNASVDATTLVITISSKGIEDASKALDKLSNSAERAEKATNKLNTPSGGSAGGGAGGGNAGAAAAGIEKQLQAMQKQVDLLGANTAARNAYNLSLAQATEMEKMLGGALGAQVDAYKRLKSDQTAAIQMNKDMTRSQSQLEVMMRRAGIEDKAQAWRKLGEAQKDAIKINREMDRSNGQLEKWMRSANVEDKARAWKQLGRDQGEALKINRDMDAQLKKNTLAEAANRQQHMNSAMAEGHAVARGLAGSLGVLWTTYGNIAGMLAGLAIGAALKGIVEQGMEVDNGLERIRIRTGENVSVMKDLKDTVFDLGKGVFAPLEVVQALDVLTMAGLRAGDAINAVSAALNLATVGGTSIDKASSTLVAIGSSIGYTTEAYSRIGDVIAKTAVSSMSSVASLSEAFKSASSVSKLYGVSLEDIATQLAALSNLGIQGSAAGTAVKNSYKELASDADKIQKTFKKLGMTEFSVKNLDGSFKDIVTVIAQLDKGLKNVSENSAKKALAVLTNERGLRNIVQLLDMYRTSIKGGGNALEDLRKQIADSYAFNAIAAAQMALTTKNSFTSVFNTMKVQFAEAFSSMDPFLRVFARRMKDAVSSPEFQTGLKLIAEGFARLTVFLVENIGTIYKFIESVTPLGEKIRWLYSLMRPSDGARAAEEAKAYSDSFVEGLQKEYDNLVKLNAKMRENKGLKDAAREVDAENEKDSIRKKYDAAIKATLAKPQWMTLGRFTNKTEAERLARERDRQIVQIENLINKTRQQAKVTEELNTAQLKAQKKGGFADNDPPEDPTKAQISDKYNTELKRIQGQIDAEKRSLVNAKEQYEAYERRGDMGKLTMIKMIAEAEEASATRTIALLYKKMAVAKSLENKEAAGQEIANTAQAQIDAREAAVKRGANQEADYIKEATDQALASRVEALKKEGKFRDAFILENETKYEQMLVNLEEDYGNTEDAATQAAIGAKATAAEAALAAGTQSAAVMDTVHAYKLLELATANVLDKAAETEGKGIGSMWTDATEAASTYLKNLPKMQAALKAAQDAAKGGGDEDLKKVQDLVKLQEEASKKFNKMWKNVGQGIGEALEAGFGKGGKAIGELVTLFGQYNDGTKKSVGDQIGMYGKVAGAAKNFFKEGTAGYKVMEKASQAFHIIEMGLEAKRLITSLLNTTIKTTAIVAGEQVVTQATVGEELKRNIIKIPGVIMQFMSNMGPWGAAAAAVAIGAVLGGSFGGGSSKAPESAESRQKSNGTGSVLGDKDAKSESIKNSVEISARNSGLGLVHSGKMVNSLNTLVNNIGSLSSLILRNAGLTGALPGKTSGGLAKMADNSVSGMPIIGIFDKLLGGKLGEISGKITNAIFGGNKTALDTGLNLSKATIAEIAKSGVNANQYTDTKTDGGIFHSDKYNTDMKTVGPEINDQFGKVFLGLRDAIKGGAKLLGIDGDAFNDKLNSFVVEMNLSLKDLKGEQITEALQTAFSKLGDDMAKFSVEGLTKFQKVGEGYLETLVRVANELEQVSDVFAMLGDTFDKTGIDAVNITQSMIEAAGGLEKLTETASYFSENILTAEERLVPIKASLDKRLAELGESELTSIELYKAKVLALKGSNVADQQLLVDLMALAPAFKAVADAAKDAGKNSEVHNKLRALDIQLERARGNEAGAVLMERLDEITALKALSPWLAERQQQIWDEEDKTKKLVDAKAALKTAYDAEANALKTTIDRFKNFTNTIKTFRDSLTLGQLSPLTPEQKYTEARAQYESVLKAAMSGDTQAQDKLTAAAQAFLDASRVVNASDSVYTSDFNMVTDAMKDVEKWSVKQVDIAQASLDALNLQVKGLFAVENAVLSVAEAIKQLSEAGDKTALGNNNEVVSSLYKGILGREGEAAGMAYWTEQLGKGLPIQQMVKYFYDSDEYKSKEAALSGGLITGTQSGSSMDVVVDELKALRSEKDALLEEVRMLRADVQTNTEVTVNATIASSNANAKDIAMALQTSTDLTIRAQEMKAIIR